MLSHDHLKGKHSKELISESLLDLHNQKKLKLGDRVSDKIAQFGGSWTFILSFLGFLILWMIFNSLALFVFHFDPYPFILLNLILSSIAAIQAPIIMMSQNRQAEKDRERAELDYQINVKSEKEIRLLQEKVDHLMDEHHAMFEHIDARFEQLLSIFKGKGADNGNTTTKDPTS